MLDTPSSCADVQLEVQFLRASTFCTDLRPVADLRDDADLHLMDDHTVREFWQPLEARAAAADAAAASRHEADLRADAALRAEADLRADAADHQLREVWQLLEARAAADDAREAAQDLRLAALTELVARLGANS